MSYTIIEHCYTMVGLEKRTDQGIIELVSDYVNANPILTTNSRKMSVVHVRHYLIHLLKTSTTRSLSSIGEIFNRDHSTVIHSSKRHLEYMQHPQDKKYIEHTEKVRNKFDEYGLYN